MKQKANKSARIQEGKGESHWQTGTTVLVFIYVQDKFICLNFLKRTVQKKNKSLTKEKKIVHFCSSVILCSFFVSGTGRRAEVGAQTNASKADRAFTGNHS